MLLADRYKKHWWISLVTEIVEQEQDAINLLFYTHMDHHKILDAGLQGLMSGKAVR